MKVLVVEDDGSVRETLGMVLESFRHEPVLLPDGEALVERLALEWPDVLLLDLSLPGISGEEVFTRVLTRFGKVPPTVVLSAAQEGESRTSRMPGALFLAKPYTLEQLDAILREAVRGIAA